MRAETNPHLAAITVEFGSMIWAWFLPLWLFIAWCFCAAAEISQNELRILREKIPASKRPGVSILPGIVIGPIFFYAIAAGIDWLSGSMWGTWVIGGLHVVWVLICAALIARDFSKRRTIKRLERLENAPSNVKAHHEKP